MQLDGLHIAAQAVNFLILLPLLCRFLKGLLSTLELKTWLNRQLAASKR